MTFSSLPLLIQWACYIVAAAIVGYVVFFIGLMLLAFGAAILDGFCNLMDIWFYPESNAAKDRRAAKEARKNTSDL